MKKLLVIVVLMLTVSPALFASHQHIEPAERSNLGFWNGFLGRSKDIQDCRTAIQGDVSPLETAALMAVTKNSITADNADDIAKIFTAISAKVK